MFHVYESLCVCSLYLYSTKPCRRSHSDDVRHIMHTSNILFQTTHACAAKPCPMRTSKEPWCYQWALFAVIYDAVYGHFPEPSKTISNRSASDSSSKSNVRLLLWLLLLLWLPLVVDRLSHWESILPMENSSLLSS